MGKVTGRAEKKTKHKIIAKKRMIVMTVIVMTVIKDFEVGLGKYALY